MRLLETLDSRDLVKEYICNLVVLSATTQGLINNRFDLLNGIV